MKMHDFREKSGISREKMRDFGVKCGIFGRSEGASCRERV